jgi:hypothetical protein
MLGTVLTLGIYHLAAGADNAFYVLDRLKDWPSLGPADGDLARAVGRIH